MKLLARAFAIFCALWVLTSPAHGQALSGTPSRESESLTDLMPIGEKAPHPITFQDIIATRQLAGEEVQISPDGKHVAFVIRQAVLDDNGFRTGLFVVNTDGRSEPVKLLFSSPQQKDSPSQIRWSPDGQSITYLSSKSGTPQVWEIQPDGGDAEQLTNHETGINKYAWSPDGTRISFVSSEAVPPPDEKSKIAERGILYDDSLGYWDLMTNSWIKKAQQLWIYDVGQRKERKLWEDSSRDNLLWGDSLIYGFFWSPNGQWIALSTSTKIDLSKSNNYFLCDIGVVAVDTGRYLRKVSRFAGVTPSNIIWSPNSKSIAFTAEGNVDEKPQSFGIGGFILNLDADKPEALFAVGSQQYLPRLKTWSSDGSKIYVERRHPSGKSTLYVISANGGDFQEVIHSNEYLSHFSFNKNESRVACLEENTTTPSDIVVFDLNNGASERLTSLNGEYQNILLSRPSKLEWENKYGIRTYGYLLKPLDYVQGRRYPLLVILYSFPGNFVSNFLGNYPIQVFAANGFAVLLVNAPPYAPYHFGDFKAAAISLAYSPMASIQKAVEMVVQMGVADPQRKGIMGWSYGSLLTDFTITHSDIFQVASTGDHARETQTVYFLQNAQGRNFQDSIFGGYPYGTAAKNWREYSPSLNAARVKVPVLMEYACTYCGLEFYTSLKKEGKQVELIIYPGAPHVFYDAPPKYSFYSMQRNVDWFNFWLQGKEDPDPAKAERYKRWRELRKLQEESERKQTGKQ